MTQRVVRLLYYGLPAAVAAAAFISPLIVHLDYAVLSPGDEVSAIFVGNGVVERIDGEQVAIRRRDGSLVTAPAKEVTER